MKAMLKRIILILAATILLIPVAHADLDGASILRNRSSYAYAIQESRDDGACRMLHGDIPLTVIIVAADGQRWDINDLDTASTCVKEAIATMEREAAAYGVALDVTPKYYRTTASSDTKAERWRQDVIASIPELQEVSSWHNHPVLFILNTEGRSYASTGDQAMEYCVFHLENDAGTVRHELLHLFGAEDFYFHPDLEAAAERHFPNSVMLHSRSSAVIDPLTAYLIGWTDEPDAVASAFLQDISHLTRTDVEQARESDQQSGVGTFELASGMYYGHLDFGCCNGIGLHQWGDGSTYVGEWNWNTADGKGTLSWPDGRTYTGDFVNDKRTGKGTFSWPDGRTYTGDFVNGACTGKGTFSWPDGCTYTGDFVNGARTGRGTFSWPDGRTYTGDFVNNAITGMGMMHLADGAIYIGQFKNGGFDGFGTMYYADGSICNGNWLHNTFVGN